MIGNELRAGPQNTAMEEYRHCKTMEDGRNPELEKLLSNICFALRRVCLYSTVLMISATIINSITLNLLLPNLPHASDFVQGLTFVPEEEEDVE